MEEEWGFERRYCRRWFAIVGFLHVKGLAAQSTLRGPFKTLPRTILDNEVSRSPPNLCDQDRFHESIEVEHSSPAPEQHSGCHHPNLLCSKGSIHLQLYYTFHTPAVLYLSHAADLCHSECPECSKLAWHFYYNQVKILQMHHLDGDHSQSGMDWAITKYLTQGQKHNQTYRLHRLLAKVSTYRCYVIQGSR